MKREVIELVVNVNDIITPTSCAKMIIELIKFIIYQTELIPYPYERLKMCINKHKELELITVSMDCYCLTLHIYNLLYA